MSTTRRIAVFIGNGLSTNHPRRWNPMRRGPVGACSCADFQFQKTFCGPHRGSTEQHEYCLQPHTHASPSCLSHQLSRKVYYNIRRFSAEEGKCWQACGAVAGVLKPKSSPDTPAQTEEPSGHCVFQAGLNTEAKPEFISSTLGEPKRDGRANLSYHSSCED